MSKLYISYYRYYKRRLAEVYERKSFIEVYRGLKALNYEMWTLPTTIGVKRYLVHKSFGELMAWIRHSQIPYWLA